MIKLMKSFVIKKNNNNVVQIKCVNHIDKILYYVVFIILFYHLK